MKKVDLFIIDAAKCGATSLAEYLKYYPDIDFSRKQVEQEKSAIQ